MKKIYYIKGNWFSRRNFIDNIKKQIKDYDLYIYDETYSFEYIINQISQIDIFGNKKLIIFNGWPSVAKKSQKPYELFMKKIFPNIFNQCYLILNNLKTNSKKFINSVKKYGEYHFFKEQLYRNDIIRFVKKFCNNRNKKIKEDVLFFLIDSLLNFNKTIKTEELILLLKQIEHIIGSKQNIKKDDILLAYIHTDNFVIWHLFDLLDNKKFSDSLYLIEKQINNSNIPKTEAFNLLSMFSWRYQLLLLLKNYKKNNISENEILNKMMNMKKIKFNEHTPKNNNIKYSKKVIEIMFKKSTLEFYTYNQLVFINDTIYNAMIRMRELQDNNSINIMLKLICLVIIGKINKKSQLGMLTKSIYEIY
ncbi:MAG: hypothetical protein ACOCP8_07750 [archaeon]